jgi:hypothetical protein
MELRGRAAAAPVSVRVCERAVVQRADTGSPAPMCVQSYSQVQNFANQEAAKAAMNHMRWGLQAQVNWAAEDPCISAAVCVLVLPHVHCSTSSLPPGWGMLRRADSACTHSTSTRPRARARAPSAAAAGISAAATVTCTRAMLLSSCECSHDASIDDFMRSRETRSRSQAHHHMLE